MTAEVKTRRSDSGPTLAEQKVKELQAQIDAYRDFSTALAHDT